MKPEKHPQSHFLNWLAKIIVFDMWLLLTIRRLGSPLVRCLMPIVKVFFYMFLGAVMIIGFGMFQTHRYDLLTYENKFSDSKIHLSTSDTWEPLQIESDPIPHSQKIERELMQLKRETKKLETSFRRMKFHLTSICSRSKNNDLSMPDFAAEAVGGMILATPGTETYHKPKSSQLTLFGFPIWKPDYYSPRKIIQPWSQPGECWAFSGSRGKVEIELAHVAQITQVTLEHIPTSAALTGVIDTAPKHFNVFGKMSMKYELLGTFEYKNTGPSSQSFHISKMSLRNKPYQRVMLEILSNHGNPTYTCIYRFKVHGKICNVVREMGRMGFGV